MIDKLSRLKKITGESDEELLNDCLDSAATIIQSRRYPFADEWPEDIEPRYVDLQIRIAQDLYNRIGAEGQTSHSENGISRQWGAEWVSSQLLAEIIPKAGVTN